MMWRRRKGVESDDGMSLMGLVEVLCDVCLLILAQRSERIRDKAKGGDVMEKKKMRGNK